MPFLMDEAVCDLHTILEVWKESAADIIGLKTSKFGGVTKMKQVFCLNSTFKSVHTLIIYFTNQAMDLCVSLGLAMTVDDSWGCKLRRYKNNKILKYQNI